MIKIQTNTYPVIYQVDRSYLLPSVTGQIRWNGSDKNFEVCDTYGTWLKIDNTVELMCSAEYIEVMEWAKKKIKEEKELEKLAALYPAVKDLKEKLDITLALVKEEIK